MQFLTFFANNSNIWLILQIYSPPKNPREELVLVDRGRYSLMVIKT